MPKIVFFCPPTSVINGGIRQIFRMTETLIALGFDACVFEQTGQRPQWFPSSAPVFGQDLLARDADHVYVLPEDQPHILESFKSFPQKKVIYSQNHFYGALGIGEAASYADYGVTDILCSSKTIFEHACLRHPTLNAYVIPCAIDVDLFKPGSFKRDTIAYMPRKRAIEATYLRDMFRFTYPQHRNWTWVPITNLSEAETASILGGSKLFLSLSRLEGFGLAPLEAMAAGCIVAGFTGIGGRDYATPQNGFWASEDDFPACVSQIKAALDLTSLDGPTRSAFDVTVQKTLGEYTLATFTKAVKDAWARILDR